MFQQQQESKEKVNRLSARPAGEVQVDRGDSAFYGNAHNIFVIPLTSGQVLRGSARSRIPPAVVYGWQLSAVEIGLLI